MKFSDSSCIRFYETYDEALRNGALDSLFLKHLKSVLASFDEQTKGKNLSSIIFNNTKQPQTYGIENFLPSSGQEKHFYEFIEKECLLIAANEELSNKLKGIELNIKKILISRSAAHAELLEKAFSEKEKKDYISFYKTSLLKLRFLVDLAWMVKEHDLDRNHVLRYFGDYGDFESRELVQENNDWIEKHEEKFKKFLENRQNQEILEWYKELSVKFEKLSVKEQSLFFIESFLVFALTPDKKGNLRGAWRPLKTIFYLGRFYNIHLMPIEWVDKVPKDKNPRIPEKMKELARNRYKSIQDGKNGVCLYTPEQINRALNEKIKGRKSIQINSLKFLSSEIQNPDSRAIDNLPSGSDFETVQKALYSSLFGIFLKATNYNFKEIQSNFSKEKFIQNISQEISKVVFTALEKGRKNIDTSKLLSILESVKHSLPELIKIPNFQLITSEISPLPFCTIGDILQWQNQGEAKTQELILKLFQISIETLKNRTSIPNIS